MFPHPCGEELRQAALSGADKRFVVPDEYVVVKGGTTPLPEDGGVFSGVVGPTLEAAACAVPHGQLRVSTVGGIRAAGGAVVWKAEESRYLTMNYQHVNIIEAGPTTFAPLLSNPVPLAGRIDGDKLNRRRKTP